MVRAGCRSMDGRTGQMEVLGFLVLGGRRRSFNIVVCAVGTGSVASTLIRLSLLYRGCHSEVENDDDTAW